MIKGERNRVNPSSDVVISVLKETEVSEYMHILKEGMNACVSLKEM